MAPQAAPAAGPRPVSRELRLPRGAGALIECIRGLLAEQAPFYPGLECLAAQCCIAPRTLKRRLASHGLSFQDLLDQLRSAHALRLLAQPELSVEKIAEQVGYSSPANFHRAFRRWTGSSPGAFRDALSRGLCVEARGVGVSRAPAGRPPAVSVAAPS